MKKIFALLVFLALMVFSSALAEINFDISPFENNSNFEVAFDDMNDTCEINCVDEVRFLGVTEGGDGILMGIPSVKILDGIPPVLRINFFYTGEDWVYTDKVILKPADTRYTFKVDRDTDVVDGNLYESFGVVLTDESVKLFEDIISGGITSIRYRLDGDRDVDGNLLLSNLEVLTDLYNCYKLSGALENDFSVLRQYYPCTIK